MERATFEEVEAALPFYMKRAERRIIAIERDGQVCIVMLPFKKYERLVALDESAFRPNETETPDADT